MKTERFISRQCGCPLFDDDLLYVILKTLILNISTLKTLQNYGDKYDSSAVGSASAL